MSHPCGDVRYCNKTIIYSWETNRIKQDKGRKNHSNSQTNTSRFQIHIFFKCAKICAKILFFIVYMATVNHQRAVFQQKWEKLSSNLLNRWFCSSPCQVQASVSRSVSSEPKSFCHSATKNRDALPCKLASNGSLCIFCQF